MSIGITGTLYSWRNDKKTNYKGGHTFGVMLNPNPNLKVGIAYNKFPEEMSKAQFRLERIENETVTSGISYYPDKNTILSLDLRNLNKEDSNATREIHAGIERNIGGIFAVRAGYYRKKETKDDVFSVGFGVLPRWDKISKFATSSRNDVISYTFVIEDKEFENSWHVFSLLLRY